MISMVVQAIEFPLEISRYLETIGEFYHYHRFYYNVDVQVV